MRFAPGLLAAAALAAPMMVHAALVAGTPAGGAGATPTPRFGTLIDFDDQPTGSCMAADQYAAQGVVSIVNALGPSLCYFESSQSGSNYIGTGYTNDWDADITFEFGALQAAVGIGIAGPTAMRFELLGSDGQVLEAYDVGTTDLNAYYFINRAGDDARFLHVSGDFIAIDDLQFDVRTVQPVPEPETLALMGLGLGALALATRRRRRAGSAAQRGL